MRKPKPKRKPKLPAFNIYRGGSGPAVKPIHYEAGPIVVASWYKGPLRPLR